MAASTHRVEVVPVVLEPHPNADSLSLVRVHGFTVCVRTADWLDRAIGAYIQPDSVVDSARPEFAFLAGHERIRVKRLRGIVSMGLLVPAPDGSAIGDDVASVLGVTHYEPPMKGEAGIPRGPSKDAAPPPRIYAPVYDLESARRYAQVVMEPGEPVIVTEKIHGANGRWLFDGERFHAGSRTEWKVEAREIIWWQALNGCEALREYLRTNPGDVVYGEVYGQVQDLKYGVESGVRVAVFDILRGSEWIDAKAAREVGAALPWVPTIAFISYDWRTLETCAEGLSQIEGANHVREGCVVKPLRERTHPEVGRVCLKVIGNGYLERP